MMRMLNQEPLTIAQELWALGIDSTRAGNLLANAFANLPRTRSTRPRNWKTRGRVQWEQDLETFSHADEGARNSTLVNLALRGRSLEISGNFPDGQTADLLRTATTLNGYYDENPSATENQIQYMRDVADENHDEELAKGSYKEGGAGVASSTTSCTTPSCTTYQLQRFIDEVYESSLAPSIKRQLYVAAYIQNQHPDWTHLVMSARATSAAAEVSKRLVGSNWRKAEKWGFISFNPGVDYATAKEVGVDSRSAEITLNLDVYPDLPVKNPKVKLNDYHSQASNFMGYVKYQRKFLKDERTAYLQNENMTATKPTETVKPLRPLKPKKSATLSPLPTTAKKPSASLSAGLAAISAPTMEERYERDKALGKSIAQDRSLEEYTKLIKMIDSI